MFCSVFMFVILLLVAGQTANGQSFIEWTRLVGSTGSDVGVSVTVDGDSNSYATGYTNGNLHGFTLVGGNDVFIVKYYANSTRAWTRMLATTLSDFPYGISYDATSDAVYVCGYTNGNLDGITNAGSSDAFVVKYDRNGNKQWTRLFGTSFSDAGFGIASLQSAVYVTGYTGGALDGQTAIGAGDAFLIKYDSAGTKQWTRLFGGTSVDQSNAVTVDSSGNVYVTGYTYSNNIYGNTNAGVEDIFVTKYSSSGTMSWFKLFGTSSSDYGNAIMVDAAVNIYVAGNTFGSLHSQTNAGSGDIFVMKLDGSTGSRLYTIETGTSASDAAYGLAMNETESDFFVVGSVGASLNGATAYGSSDMVVLKYDTSGTLISTRIMGSSSTDSALAVAKGKKDNLYVVGRTSGSLNGKTYTGSVDAAIVKLSNTPPTMEPTMVPTWMPTVIPTNEPTFIPTASPSIPIPSADPTLAPSEVPTEVPTYRPTQEPTYAPSAVPTEIPSYTPSFTPTAVPTEIPTYNPSASPSFVPTVIPTAIPSAEPSYEPSAEPTAIPTYVPSFAPSAIPTETPTYEPTAEPSCSPTHVPTVVPTFEPTYVPSSEPTQSPTYTPSNTPSAVPSETPTYAPTAEPSFIPTDLPSVTPSMEPTFVPSTTPTYSPSEYPSHTPSEYPTEDPTYVPSAEPTLTPSFIPTTIPTFEPTADPSATPSYAPSAEPTMNPSYEPTAVPTFEPTTMPTHVPTYVPTMMPTMMPTAIPTAEPSAMPSVIPTYIPSMSPSSQPSSQPSSSPSVAVGLDTENAPEFVSSPNPTSRLLGVVLGTVGLVMLLGLFMLLICCLLKPKLVDTSSLLISNGEDGSGVVSASSSLSDVQSLGIYEDKSENV